MSKNYKKSFSWHFPAYGWVRHLICNNVIHLNVHTIFPWNFLHPTTNEKFSRRDCKMEAGFQEWKWMLKTKMITLLLFNKCFQLCFNQCANKCSNIFEYFPLTIDIRIRFVAIFKAKYYSNIRIFLYKYFRILVFKNHLNYLN